MSISLNFPSKSLNMPKVLYYPAEYKKLDSIGHVVQYSVYDAESNSMKRTFIRLNTARKKYATLREFKAYVYELMATINLKLQQYSLLTIEGVVIPSSEPKVEPTPAVQPSVAEPIVAPVEPEPKKHKKRHNLQEVVSNFMNEKTKELRHASIRSYGSFTAIFLSWCKDNHIKYVDEVEYSTIAEFMNNVYNERNVSAVTYNNYVKLGRTLFTWLVDRCFTDSNKFEKIKKKTAGEKNRTLIAPAHRKQLLEATNIRPHYATLCMLVYSALIRPNEIRQIQLKHIHLDDCYIEIPGENAKNHHTRRSALTPQLVERLRSMNLDRYPADYYLFGSYIEPDKDMAAESTYRSYFDKVRERLGWDSRYTLYSFRDTGITEMLEAGIPNIDVMKHADHSSLDVTTIYTRHKDKSLIDKISSRAPKF